MDLINIVNYFGSKKKLAHAVGTSNQNVNNWKKKGYVPTKWAIQIEKASNGKITREQIRPDIYER